MTPYFYENGLESARLRTRWIEAGDIARMVPFFEDPQSIAYMPIFNQDGAEGKARFMIEKQWDRYKNQRYGLQALMEKSTGEFVGLCGLLAQEVADKQELEVGYHLLQQHRGKGYASEAAKCFMDYGFRHQQADSIISIIHVENVPSQRVAERNGLQRSEVTTWNGFRVYLYRMAAPALAG